MNLLRAIDEGIEGLNEGLPFRISRLNEDIGGIHPAMIYTLGAPPKVGKTSFINENFVLSPFFYALEHNLDVEWWYWATEMSRIETEANMLSTVLHYQNPEWQYSSEYILGRARSQDGSRVIVTPEHRRLFEEVYNDLIVPLTGSYDPATGRRIRTGKLNFFQYKENPTGIFNMLIHALEQEGDFITETVSGDKEVRHGWVPHNPEKRRIVVIDHIRGLKRERNFTLKENMDKMTEYQTLLRNWTNMSFVNSVHLNRGIVNVERIKYMKETLYPTDEDLKDSGNASEDSNYVITLFDPADPKYNISRHFGINVNDYGGNYRSLHICKARNAPCPMHYALNFHGNVKTFEYIDPH